MKILHAARRAAPRRRRRRRMRYAPQPRHRARIHTPLFVVAHSFPRKIGLQLLVHKGDGGPERVRLLLVEVPAALRSVGRKALTCVYVCLHFFVAAGTLCGHTPKR